MNSNTKNSIINLAEYGIALDSIAGFLNNRLYTDCHSNLLYNVNGKKGMAVYVERSGFKPQVEPGGFMGHCTNNIDQYRADIKITGTPREVELYRGNWGFWDYDFFGGMCPRRDEYQPGAVVNGELVVDWGDGYVRFARLLPSGKPAKKFYKLGKLNEYCGALYDYNF